MLIKYFDNPNLTVDEMMYAVYYTNMPIWGFIELSH